jgi:serine/threonine protein kinase
MSMPNRGDRVGEYILDERVGAGAFGEVWRAAHHVWTDRIVAVKVPTDPEYVRALQREGAAVHGLDHPNIVKPINFDPYAVPPYLAMEYVPGTSLRGLLQAGRPEWKDASAILRQVLAALAYAHSMGMVHRDIKPENVLIHERTATEGYAVPGLVKLTDFGLGQRATQYAAHSIAYTASIEKGSELAGTIAYMSPEQRSGITALDGRSDLYSCGVMLFELLTGERPAGTELPTDLVRKAYARLELRYTSADEFSRDLARASGLGPMGVPLPPPLGRSPAGSPPDRSVLSSCPKCRRAVGTSDQFCMHCGCQLVDRVRRCTTCGAYPHTNDKFCMVCGKPLVDAPVTLEAGQGLA